MAAISSEHLVRLSNAIVEYLPETKLTQRMITEWANQSPDPIFDIILRSMNSASLSEYEFTIAAARIIPDIAAVFGNDVAEIVISGVKDRLSRIMTFPEAGERAAQVLRDWGLDEVGATLANGPLSLLGVIARSVNLLPPAIGDVLIAETIGLSARGKLKLLINPESGLGAENGRVKIGRGAAPEYNKMGSCTLLLKRGKIRKFDVLWVGGDAATVSMTPSDISDIGYNKGDIILVFFV